MEKVLNMSGHSILYKICYIFLFLKGFWRNFNFQHDLSAQEPKLHKINPSLNQLFVDQYLMWSNFRDQGKFLLSYSSFFDSENKFFNYLIEAKKINFAYLSLTYFYIQ